MMTKRGSTLKVAANSNVIAFPERVEEGEFCQHLDEEESVDDDGRDEWVDLGCCGNGGLFGTQHSNELMADCMKDEEERRFLTKLNIGRQLSEFFTELHNESGLSVQDFAKECGISHVTYAKIIMGTQTQTIRVGTFVTALERFNKALTIKLVGQESNQATLLFRFDGKPASEFCSAFFRQCRAVSGITRSELDIRLSSLKEENGSSSGYSSKVERGLYKNGVSFGILIDVANVCDLQMSILEVAGKQ